MFKRVGSLIKTLPNRSKTPGAIVALQVRQTAGETLKRVLKEYPVEVEKKVKVGVFKNGVLVIIAPSTIASELHLRSVDLLAGINQSLGRKIIRAIKFKAG